MHVTTTVMCVSNRAALQVVAKAVHANVAVMATVAVTAKNALLAAIVAGAPGGRGRERGERRERSPDSGKSYGERRSVSDRAERNFSKSEGGDRKSNFAREKRPRKQ